MKNFTWVVFYALMYFNKNENAIIAHKTKFKNTLFTPIKSKLNNYQDLLLI
jgi:hypothetical protein